MTTNIYANTVQYQYDSMGRLTRVSNSNGSIVEYSYDKVGNRVRFFQSDGIAGIGDGEYSAAADFSGNQLVDIEDLALLRAAYGSGRKSACHDARFDLNGDKLIDEQDVLQWFTMCPEERWLEGDWTGARSMNAVDVLDSSPDGRVDFWDLVALAKYWGSDANGGPYKHFLDISPSGVPGIIDRHDLDLFAGHWLSGWGPVPEACLGSSAITERDAYVLTEEGRVLARASSMRSDIPATAYIEVVLSGAPDEVSCFQFGFSANLPLDDTLADGVEITEGVLRMPGDPGLPESVAVFSDLCRGAEDWVVTGAFLDLEPAYKDGGVVLCSLLVPAQPGEHEFQIAEVQYATRSGTVHSSGSWNGTIQLLDVPERTMLSQVYPNPFNPLTTIKYAVAIDGPVVLGVYDIQGRLVRTLVEENLPAGWYEEAWDGLDNRGRAASSGTYFVRLQDKSWTMSRKMMLVR